MSTYGAKPEEVLEALSDSTRRRVFELLRGGELAVGKIADDLPVSRPAVSQHLKILKGAGLVSERREGTRHLYAIDAVGLTALRSYLETFWDVALTSFASAVDEAAETHPEEGR